MWNLCVRSDDPSAVTCATVTEVASEAVIFLAEGGRSALIGCDFRAESREAVAALAAVARAATLQGAAFRVDLEAALAGRLVFTELLFIKQL
jgi:phosphomannomutase